MILIKNEMNLYDLENTDGAEENPNIVRQVAIAQGMQESIAMQYNNANGTCVL